LRPGLLVLLLIAAACGGFLAPGAGSAEDTALPGLWMPWEGGSVWRYSYGPHSGSSSVSDALDFQPLDSGGKQCETFTSAHWAVAAADGRAILLPNAVEVDHGGGFRTGYYHLADKQVRTGDEVKAGQRLGRPGCCPDGGTGTSCWSTDPHLHFYTVLNGARRPIVGTVIGGWLVGEDGCLAKAGAIACRGASIMSNTPRSGQVSAPPPLAVTVAFDVSGSMRSSAESGELLRLTAPYLEEASRRAGLTVIAFNSHARVLLRPGESHPLEELAGAVGGVTHEGDTDLNAGLSMACREMTARGAESRQALVLITDGVHNGGGRLREPQRCFTGHGWPVFAYGTGKANRPLLERIATMTGGEFRPASEIFDPVCEMERLRALMSALPSSQCTRYLLRSGETLSVPLTVPPDQTQLALAVSWMAIGKGEGEPSVKTTVRQPSGTTLAADVALSHESEAAAERYAVDSPAAGDWEAVISGSGLPPAGVLLSISFGTTPVGFSTAGPTETPAPEETPTEQTPDGSPVDTLTPTPDSAEGPEDTSTPGPTKPPRQTGTPVPSPPAPPTPTPRPRNPGP
jgi:hypothetical protein